MIEVKNKAQCVAAMELVHLFLGMGTVMQLRMSLAHSGPALYEFVRNVSSDPVKTLESIIQDTKSAVDGNNWEALDLFSEFLCRVSYIGNRLNDYDTEANKFSVWLQSFIASKTGRGFKSVPLQDVYEILDNMKFKLGNTGETDSHKDTQEATV